MTGAGRWPETRRAGEHLRTIAWNLRRQAAALATYADTLDDVTAAGLLGALNDAGADLPDFGGRIARAMHTAPRTTGMRECCNGLWAHDATCTNARAVRVAPPVPPPPESCTRPKAAPRMIEWRGESKTIGAWAKTLGMPDSLLRYRLANGWDVERAFTTPVDAAHSARVKASRARVAVGI